MIDFTISNEIIMLEDSVNRFIEKELLPLEQVIQAKGYLPECDVIRIRNQAQSLGFWAMGVPEQFGGAGLDAVTLCFIYEKLGKVSDILVRRTFGAIPTALFHANEYQKNTYLQPAVSGLIHISTAMSEAGAGSDASAIKTQVKSHNHGWILSGSKHFVSDADYASAFIVTAKNEYDGKISCFIVDKSCSGVILGRNQEMMGLTGVHHHEIFFDNCVLSTQSLLGEIGKGLATILGAKNKDRLISVGARSVGLAQHILEMSIHYAKERIQFGQPIGQFQLIQKMLSDMQIRIYAARMMLLNTAWQIDNKVDCREHISAVKIFATETLDYVVDQAIQVFGGAGYTTEYPLERYYRDSRINRIYEGTNEIHHLSIAKSLFKHGAFGFLKI